jgi:protocatechuate 3,4-dioxygenase beta subunit
MKRGDFLKKSLSSISVLATVPALATCTKANVEVNPDASNPIVSDPSITPSNCVVTNSETAGPFPTKKPTDFIIQNIIADRKGTPTTLKIYIRNVNNGCAIIKDAVVDVWHCDAEGEYSEYGNSSNAHFLRGRQNTDANGMAAWKTVFPGWYSGRAPHIHVQVFNSAGKSLLTTQIAFPKAECDKVYTQGAYKSRGLQNTTNERDGIFSDGVGTEMATITGNVNDGIEMIHTIYVKG